MSMMLDMEWTLCYDYWEITYNGGFRMGLPERRDVPVEQTWDVSVLYSSDEEWRKDIEAEKADLAAFSKYDGKLDSADAIAGALDDLGRMEVRMDRLSHYGFLQQAADMTDPAANQRLRILDRLNAEYNAALDKYRAQIMDNDDGVLDAVTEKRPDLSAAVREFKRIRKHRLSGEVEGVLSKLSPALTAQEGIYTTCRAADMTFPDFVAGERTYPLSFVLYENSYQYNPDPEVRHAAFKAFSGVLRQYRNTIAANYYAQVSKEKIMATLRGFDSVFDYLLDDQEVPREFFDRQIDVIIDRLGPVMQKYVKLIQKERGLDRMTFSDLQIDLDPDFAPKVPLSEAPKYISDAVGILGPEYHDMIMKCFEERWVDFPANKGKETGGFETTPYDCHPYILMSWTNEMADAYTLVHELGHAGQELMTHRTNHPLGCNVSTYIVEAPSTFNELLLTHSLEEKSDDKRMQRFALTKMLTNTYYHNFVTHLLEAAFQREVYRLIDKGEGFDGDRLCEIKKSVLKRFWGDTVDIDDDAALTWMRQSHYYMGLYPYTYSASLTVSTQAYLKIREQGQPAVDAWLKFLKFEGCPAPVEAARTAGVDITTDEPLRNTIAFLDQTVDRIAELTEELK